MVTGKAWGTGAGRRNSLAVGALALAFMGIVTWGGFLPVAPLRAQYPVVNKWQFEKIPAPPDLLRAPAIGDVAGNLAVDAEGRVHLLLGYPTLSYAVRDETGWSFQIVGPGSDPSLALDSAGEPHMTYYHQDAIHYTVLEKGAWVVKHSVGVAGSPNGLALDAADQPHIAYISPGPNHASPAYATRDGGLWQETGVAPNWATSNVGIALDAEGRPTVVYERMNYLISEYQFVGATPDPAGDWQESMIISFYNYNTVVYDWRPDTMRVSTDSEGRTLVSWFHGEEFIIKPTHQMYYYVSLARHTAGLFEWLAGASMDGLGYGTVAPSSVAHGAGLSGDAFLEFIIDDDLWFADTGPGSRPWQKIAEAWFATAPAVGPDGQPRIVFGNSEGLWYGRRGEVELSSQVFMPVLGNRWVGNWIATDPTGVTSAVWGDALGRPTGNPSSHPVISADSRYVAFESTISYSGNQDITGVFLSDRATGNVWCISVNQAGTCQSDSELPVISADGRYVAFETSANLLPADNDHGDDDIYLYDVAAATLSLVSDSSGLTQVADDATYPAISADGRYVAYVQGSDGYGILVYDRQTGQTAPLSDTPPAGMDGGDAIDLVMSVDGRYVAFQYWRDLPLVGDSNGECDVFVYDRQTDELALASVRSDGTQTNKASGEPQISADGGYVVFTTAGNLSPADTNGASDIYRHDRRTGETVWVSRHLDQTGASSFAPTLSADGHLIAFESYANFGVAADSNAHNDVYLVEVGRTPELVSVNLSGSAGNKGSATPAISAGGQFIVFKSEADDLVAGDINGAADIFFRRVR